MTLEPGEFCVVLGGVEHRTMADAEAEILVFEPAETRNTGNTQWHFLGASRCWLIFILAHKMRENRLTPM